MVRQSAICETALLVAVSNCTGFQLLMWPVDLVKTKRKRFRSSTKVGPSHILYAAISDMVSSHGISHTFPGYNLLVRGPANYPKDGVYALEGIVETDWAVAPFTFNLKLTHPVLSVRFDVDEPICMLVPQRRGELEAFRLMFHNLESEPDIHSQYLQWNQSRTEFLASLREPHFKNEKDRWQKHYFRGTSLAASMHLSTRLNSGCVSLMK
jgi:hypothetical protein